MARTSLWYFLISNLMQTALLLKIAVWLVVIGTAALLAPNPAWPEWVSRMVLSTGIALGLTTYLIQLRSRKRHPPRKDKD